MAVRSTELGVQRDARAWLPEPRVVVRLIGDTPLVRLRELEPRAGVEIHGKAEWTNPGGSVKDRAAWFMVREGLQEGALAPGKVLIDASSGNTGIAYAFLGASLGFPVRIVLPANVTASRLRILRAYGAETVLTDPQEGMDGAIDTVRRLVAGDPELFFYPDQYNNPANWRAHYEGTGPEIIAQAHGRITHFVAGLGTTGTFTGCGRRFRDNVPGIELVAVQPDSPLHALEGLKHLATTSHVPGIYDDSLADRIEDVSSEEAQAMARRLARKEALLLGPSAAAAAVVAERVARDLETGVVVAILCDSADKYLEEPFWQ